MSLTIAMPIYRDVVPATMLSLIGLAGALNHRGVPFSVATHVGCAMVELARMSLVAQFLASDATHLLFVDADVEFPPDVVLRMVDRGVDVIGTILVEAVGMGLTLMKRTAIERLILAHAERDGDPRLFRTELRDGGGFHGEDIAFCRRWRELGGEIHALVDAPVSHHGMTAWAGNLRDYIRDPNGMTREAILKLLAELNEAMAEIKRENDLAVFGGAATTDDMKANAAVLAWGSHAEKIASRGVMIEADVRVLRAAIEGARAQAARLRLLRGGGGGGGDG